MDILLMILIGLGLIICWSLFYRWTDYKYKIAELKQETDIETEKIQAQNKLDIEKMHLENKDKNKR